MSDQATKKDFTVLPYVLGGKDDPHFQDLSARSSKVVEQPFEGLEDVGSTPTAHTLEDIGGNWTPDRIEANEDRYGKPWYEREDWEVPGNGGTNDHLFEDGDPQEYGDGSPD